MPNEMTSVGPEWPRYSRLMRLIAVVPTNATDTSASLIRSDRSVASTSALTLEAASGTRRTLEETSTRMRDAFNGLSVTGVVGVGLDDFPHEPMTDDIGVVEVVKPDAVDARKNPLDLDKS